MTNQIALVLATLVLAFFGADFVLLDGSMSLFLARKLLELTEWLAFWR